MRLSAFTLRAMVLQVLAVALLAAITRSAAAHEPFQITTEARALSDRTELHVILVRNTAAAICPKANLANVTSEQEFAAVRGQVERCCEGLYALRAEEHVLRARECHALLLDEDEVDLRMLYPAAQGTSLTFEARFFGRLSDPTYGATLTVTGERVFLGQELLRAESPSFTVSLPQTAVNGAARSAPTASFAQFLRLGVEHILTGYDHLLFLLGLLAACRRLKSVLVLVTCFTVAHSLTLGLAALGLVAPSSRLIEPLIAATIVFVAVENLLRGEDPRWRWAIALFFGLIHGFGFAGALKEIGLGANGAPILAPLFAFNLGVEIGQALVATLLLSLLWRLRKLPLFARRGTQALSVITAAIGLYWLIERVAHVI
ncbi:MAG TPA: HupE/UreJ family protein [Polyangiaceae bacterium]|jgi:hypothetical protein